MNEGLVSRRYAKALLKYAQDQHSADQIYEKMKVLEVNFLSHPELEKSLQNPVLGIKRLFSQLPSVMLQEKSSFASFV